MRRWILWTPLLAFAILFGLAASEMIRPADRTFRSRLVGKPLPNMTLSPILPEHPGLQESRGGPRLVNIFASWCVPCAAEVEQLQVLKRRGFAIDGIAVRDTPGDLSAFLSAYGDPYRAIGNDPQSRSMIALGASGVPESFVVDTAGIIRFHHVGAIGPQDVRTVARAIEAAR